MKLLKTALRAVRLMIYNSAHMAHTGTAIKLSIVRSSTRCQDDETHFKSFRYEKDWRR